MPISTPPEIAKLYGNDTDHFKHVLDCLIIPAVKTAGFEPIPPAATGSEIIHASIIKNLSDADMVLCDLSALNPNVFYELGIRTSLNKPVTLIYDEHVTKLPFDTGIINAVGYHSSMPAWLLDKEKLEISQHIQTTAEKSKGKNPMWQYFGIPQVASLPPAAEASSTQVLEIILSKIQALEKKMPSEMPSGETLRRALALSEPSSSLTDLWWSTPKASDSMMDTYLRAIRGAGQPQFTLGEPTLLSGKLSTDSDSASIPLAEATTKKKAAAVPPPAKS